MGMVFYKMRRSTWTLYTLLILVYSFYITLSLMYFESHLESRVINIFKSGPQGRYNSYKNGNFPQWISSLDSMKGDQVKTLHPITYKANIEKEDSLPEDNGYFIVPGKNEAKLGPDGLQSEELLPLTPGVPINTLPGNYATYYRPVFFLKTHKTGSSTVLNILLRYADTHNLTVALPRTEHRYHFKYYEPFLAENVIPLKEPYNQYDVMCHHMVYSRDVRNIMPPDTYYISIIREPIQLLKSLYTYFHVGDNKCNRTLNEYVEKSIPDKVPRSSIFRMNKSNTSKCGLRKWVRHSTFYDFGIEYKEIDDYPTLAKIIKSIEREFHFVMILEHFDECLVLLKDQLNWQFSDILYLTQNSFNKTTDKDDRVSSKYLSRKSRSKLRIFLKQEYIMYRYFTKVFWKKVEQYGRERLKKDVKIFRKKKAEMHDFCIKGKLPKEEITDPLLKPCCDDIPGYVLNDNVANHKTCRGLAAAEWPYTEYMRDKMALTGRIDRKYLHP